jgi:hypothetical protein
MTNKIYILAAASILSLLSLNLLAQEGSRKQKPPVNTKQETPVKIIQYLPGTWQVKEIRKGNKRIAGTDTVALNQTIVFNREGRYVRRSGTNKIDSGAYRIIENHAILYFESAWEKNEAGQYESSQWDFIQFKRNEMTLKIRAGTKEEESYTYVYARIGGLQGSDN